MIKIYQKQPIQAEQFDGTQKMADKYHISVYNENIDKYGGLGDWTPNEYTFNGTYIDVGDWIIENSGNIRLIMTNNEFKKDYAELPVIPKAIAEYIEHMKSIQRDIGEAMRYWLRTSDIDEYMEDNSETFARAWLDGYQLEAQHDTRTD